MHERLGWRAIALWTIVFCVHRGAVLWLGFDGTFYWEETYRLLMGEALWNHWPWPLLDVQADPYAGGSLVLSALAAPMVGAIGPSLVGLKTMALVWSAFGFVAWTLLIDGWFGRWPAFTFAVLFVFAPPLFVVYNLIAMGSHAEVVTTGGVQLWLAYRFLYGESHSRAALVAWGIAAGLGTWFAYTSALPFVACVGVGLVAGVLPPRRWPLLALAFAVGFLPWIAANLVGGAHGLAVLARTFGVAGTAKPDDATYIESLRYLLTKGIPLALRFPELALTLPGETRMRPLLLGQAYCALYALATAAVVLGCILRSDVGLRVRRLAARCPEFPLFVLFPLFVAILAATDQIFLVIDRVPFLPFRLLVPFLPAMMAVIAIAVGRLPTLPRALMLAVLGCFAGAATLTVLTAGASERPALSAEARTLGAEAAGHLLFYKHRDDLPRIAERIAAMPADLQAAAFEGVGFSIAYHFQESEPVARFTALLAEVPAAFRADAARGVRRALGSGMPQVNPRAPSAVTAAMLAALESLDPRKSSQ